MPCHMRGRSDKYNYAVTTQKQHFSCVVAGNGALKDRWPATFSRSIQECCVIYGRETPIRIRALKSLGKPLETA